MAFARNHLDRITPSVRTKSGRFVTNHPKFYKMFRAQLAMAEFGAMAEVLVWHAAKGSKAPEIIIDFDQPQIQAALRVALKRNWPFIPHIEFASANAQDDYDRFMAGLEGLLRAYPHHPFALTHLGQLSAGEVGRLIAAHGNIHFITSSANPLKVYNSKQPWMDMFDGGRALSSKWRALVVAHPDRFIFAIDNVWAGDWSHDYAAQVAVWRTALADLPHDVAHAVAHRNAERLWRLAPAAYVEAGG